MLIKSHRDQLELSELAHSLLCNTIKHIDSNKVNAIGSVSQESVGADPASCRRSQVRAPASTFIVSYSTVGLIPHQLAHLLC